MVKPKIRIQLLDAEHRVVSDRLVDQYTELLNGPTEPHDGPIRIEANLIDKETTDKFMEYLLKLQGVLPASVPKTKIPEVNKVNEFKEIYDLCKKAENMEKVIEILEEHNFRFISNQYLEDYEKGVTHPEEVPKDFQMMTKVLKYAKDPANDRFDLSMRIYIKFIGNKLPTEAYFIRGDKLKATLKKEWSKSSANMKEKKIPMVFPAYMDVEERKDWRAIRRKIENGSTNIPEKKMKFYTKHAQQIQNMNPHENVPLL